MHIEHDMIPKLEQVFKQRYNRDLIGKSLGQFHSDFEMSNGTSAKYSTHLIALGKKFYIDQLLGEDGITIDYHIRGKGVSQDAIQVKSKGDPMLIYERLFKRETIPFDLCGDETHKLTVFERKSWTEYICKDTFIRKIHFDSPEFEESKSFTYKNLQQNK